MEQNNRNLIYHDRVQNILRDVPKLLKRFSPEDLRAFLMTGELEFYKPGELILSEQSDQIEAAWLLADGRVSIWKEDTEIARLDPGDFIGETFLINKGQRIATVKAITSVAMIRFERSVVLGYFRSRPERIFKIFIMNLLEIQQNRIKAMNNKVVKLQQKLLEYQSENKP